jgi:hypothetical protein
MVISSLGTNHSDEIILSPEPHAHDALPTLAANGTTPNNAIQPFRDNLIEEALVSLPLQHGRDPDNDLCLAIPGKDIPFDMLCWFLTDAHYPQIFTLHCQVYPPIPKSKWTDAVFLCNEYATQYRFGRFQLRVSAEASEATLCFVSQLDLSDGTTVAFLKTFIMSHISSACGFLGEPHVQKLLVPASPRKRRTTTNSKGVMTKS